MENISVLTRFFLPYVAKTKAHAFSPALLGPNAATTFDITVDAQGRQDPERLEQHHQH